MKHFASDYEIDEAIARYEGLPFIPRLSAQDAWAEALAQFVRKHPEEVLPEVPAEQIPSEAYDQAVQHLMMWPDLKEAIIAQASDPTNVQELVAILEQNAGCYRSASINAQSSMLDPTGYSDPTFDRLPGETAQDQFDRERMELSLIGGMIEYGVRKLVNKILRRQSKSKCQCWDGYKRVPGTKPCAPGSCEKCDEGCHKKKSSQGDKPSPKAAKAVFDALAAGNEDAATELLGHTDCPEGCETHAEGKCNHQYMSAGRTRVRYLVSNRAFEKADKDAKEFGTTDHESV